MIFEPSEDQTAIQTSLERLLRPYQAISPEQTRLRAVHSAELQQALIDGGFLDIGVGDADAATASALVVDEVAKAAVAAEAAASALVRPALGLDIVPPLALAFGGADKPVRFLPQAKAVLIVGDDDAKLLTLGPGDVIEVESIFGYSMGKLAPRAAARAKPLGSPAASLAKTWWRVGLALEIHGALDSALKLIVAHVSDRRQFGRPLGSFQAIQHRLAMDATRIEACRWLALKAAQSAAPADAGLAAAYAQDVVEPVAYDLHQFTGAMGFSLEYPLRLFTYRAKLLVSELGGVHAQFAAAADALWPSQALA